MKLNKFISLSICFATLSFLAACSEARYAAHVVKQIPLPSDQVKNKGYFKVGSSYKIQGRKYYPKEEYNHTETGMASWYGPGFHGKMTANGEIFDENELTAAHRTLQMPSIVRVTNLSNGRTIILRVNDRGPFAHDRILDVSKRAASLLGFKNKGTAKIRLEVLGEASHEVAARAKAGHSTKGFEIALNQNRENAPILENKGRMITPQPALKPMGQPEPVTQVALSSPNTPTATTIGQISSQPVPLKKPMPVQAEPLNTPPKPPVLGTGRFFVQAGAFSQEKNALNFSTKMASYGPSKVYLSQVNNKPFYRVRLGPYSDRTKAAQVINTLTENGNSNAVIVTD